MILGIDSGLSGAIAFLGHPEGDRVLDLPTLEIGKPEATVKNAIDVRALAQLVTREVGEHQVLLTVIEALATGGTGEGRGNAMTIGAQYRTWTEVRTVLVLLGLEVEEVTPQRWKRMFGIPGGDEGKRLAREKAALLYPHLADSFKLVKSHNRADACLIAHWGFKCQL